MRASATLSALAVGLPLLAGLLPQVADARPFTAGVAIGRVEAEQDFDGEADSTLQVFGRLGLTQRVSGQLELQKIEGGYVNARTGTALLVVELGRSGRLVPTMFAGLGVDAASDGYWEARGSHIEGGFGLEYRLDGGLVVGADVRLGGRSVEQSDEPVILGNGTTARYAPLLVEGEYRSARIGVGVRF